MFVRLMVVLASLLAMVAVAAPDAAAAQDRVGARVAFDEAMRQFEAGNHRLALDGFRQVRELMQGDARAQVMVGYNVARALEELGRYEEALRDYERYIAEAPSDAPYRDIAADRVRELRARIGDRRAAGAGGASGSGTAESPLLPIGIAVAVAGAAAVLAAIPLGVTALDGRSQLDGMCPGGACPPSAQATIDDTFAFGLATDVLWIAGASLAALGAALAIVGSITGGSSAVTGAAFCTDGGCAAVLRGRL